MVDPAVQPSASSAVYGFWLTLAIVGIPGILGGWINCISLYLIAATGATPLASTAIAAASHEAAAQAASVARPPAGDAVTPERWQPSGRLSTFSFFLLQGASGFGGAVAALLVILWANRFPDQFDAKSLLTLAATSFIAGYVSTRLLPAIAESLLGRLKRAVEQNSGEIARARSDLAKVDRTTRNLQAVSSNFVEATPARQAPRKAGIRAASPRRAQAVSFPLSREAAAAGDATPAVKTELDAAVTSVIAYLDESSFSPAATKGIRDRLERLLPSFPTHRALNILLARVYDEAEGDRRKAIEILCAFLEAKRRAGDAADSDTASAHWNLANYYELAFADSQSIEDRTNAVNNARAAVQQRPDTYLSRLKNDPDFQELRQSPQGAVLLQELDNAAQKETPPPS